MDDFSPMPIAPSMEFLEEDTVSVQSLAHDERIAKSYFHPSWDGVEDLFLNNIEALERGTTDTTLSAEDYKIEDQVAKRTAAKLKEILIQVQNAVTATEGNRKKGVK